MKKAVLSLLLLLPFISSCGPSDFGTNQEEVDAFYSFLNSTDPVSAFEDVDSVRVEAHIDWQIVTTEITYQNGIADYFYMSNGVEEALLYNASDNEYLTGYWAYFLDTEYYNESNYINSSEAHEIQNDVFSLEEIENYICGYRAEGFVPSSIPSSSFGMVDIDENEHNAYDLAMRVEESGITITTVLSFLENGLMSSYEIIVSAGGEESSIGYSFFYNETITKLSSLEGAPACPTINENLAQTIYSDAENENGENWLDYNPSHGGERYISAQISGDQDALSAFLRGVREIKGHANDILNLYSDAYLSLTYVDGQKEIYNWDFNSEAGTRVSSLEGESTFLIHPSSGDAYYEADSVSELIDNLIYLSCPAPFFPINLDASFYSPHAFTDTSLDLSMVVQDDFGWGYLAEENSLVASWELSRIYSHPLAEYLKTSNWGDYEDATDFSFQGAIDLSIGAVRNLTIEHNNKTAEISFSFEEFPLTTTL